MALPPLHDLQNQPNNLAISTPLQTPSLSITSTIETSNEKENLTTTTEELPPTPPPEQPQPKLQPLLMHETHTSPKTQHFSRSLLLFLQHPITDYCIGQAQARYLDRAALKSSLTTKKSHKNKTPNSTHRPTFHLAQSVQSLNDGDSDALALAVAIFNADGTVMRKHTLSPSSPWGKELEEGGILVLSYLLVEREFRRQGFTSVLVKGLVERAKGARGGVRWVFVKPGVIRSDLEGEKEGSREKEEEERALERARSFYKGVGFRRVGDSRWFCLAVEG
ncbi:uncharacterized protein LY89DRAFT_757910 [Mollisia scopiformis]|uniref:N-acetyltransferase domain-containing protein n=1 Tax=Mollisia scopiformis TaxID=149040 RepID=A0A194WX72_MOLSC|nr:uncharacterized protein LY89DRAFT_757910 [Mollisia scopiformis]KUJ12187.1 hypothetical protein LY89DRAFT_757910 [Mollisia scopiformis]